MPRHACQVFDTQVDVHVLRVKVGAHHCAGTRIAKTQMDVDLLELKFVESGGHIHFKHNY